MRDDKKPKSPQGPIENSLRNSKKGAAHFEMIISLVFFVGLMVFLFTTIPQKNITTIPSSVITGLYDSIEKITFTNLSTVFVKANYTGTNTCFYIVLPEDAFTYKISNGNSYITKLNGQSVDSSIAGNNLNIKKDDMFFRIMISPEIEEKEVGGCEILNNYTLGVPTERRVASYSSLREMQDKYFNNYETLKNELRIPPIFDFAITTNTLPINMVPQHGIPASVEIAAQDYIFEVLKSNGNLTNERFTLRLW